MVAPQRLRGLQMFGARGLVTQSLSAFSCDQMGHHTQLVQMSGSCVAAGAGFSHHAFDVQGLFG